MVELWNIVVFSFNQLICMYLYRSYFVSISRIWRNCWNLLWERLIGTSVHHQPMKPRRRDHRHRHRFADSNTGPPYLEKDIVFDLETSQRVSLVIRCTLMHGIALGVGTLVSPKHHLVQHSARCIRFVCIQGILWHVEGRRGLASYPLVE